MIRVLHIDDDSSALELTKIFLNRLNSDIDLDWASSAKEGLEKLKRKRYDCVVVDYQMPKMNGLEMMERINRHKREVPFILFTGEGDEEVAARAIELGADDYIEKEFGTDHFERLMEKILEVVEINRRGRSKLIR